MRANAWHLGHDDDSGSLGARTFARRCERATGLSPVRFVQRLRVDKAMELLETTRLSLDDIAEKVGYADPSTLRKLMHREKTPGARASRAARKRDKGLRPPGRVEPDDLTDRRCPNASERRMCRSDRCRHALR
ncbi:helix-turn-helix domain-containing protein [Bradyrhizobium zhanjiangense]|uniref:helix-turn-helix domain-containing protein n=1 Tax=Bradyrhizobium zhanjiangense TaxID=1325107 RepID=UPI0024BFCD58|nr:helix-turn-helix domain-containing protein [Bradyrhizobium zhanjiangense]